MPTPVALYGQGSGRRNAHDADRVGNQAAYTVQTGEAGRPRHQVALVCLINIVEDVGISLNEKHSPGKEAAIGVLRRKVAQSCTTIIHHHNSQLRFHASSHPKSSNRIIKRPGV